MTYCLGMLLDAGLVLIADTRTNAGVDNFSCYKKLHCLAEGPDRQVFAASSGSLSVSQSVIALLEEGLPPEDKEEAPRRLAAVTSMFRAAQLVGEAVQIINRKVGAALEAIHINSSVSFLLGGRIGEESPRLFLIYAAGNFIECQPDSPFLQIGETKYGRPILDRSVDMEMPLPDAVKIAFLSFDSAMRSNLGVARPLDMVVMARDRSLPLLTRRIEPDDEYFNDMSLRWARMLHQATLTIPDPPFMVGYGGEEQQRGRGAA
ncbi:peptidase [Sphingosinicella humi]|uniref:Peptidase n=1 Tax=Allosphingosinicella humi TaxID=2068657 RepID=A0A2U2J271_9SPHN|nr:peptidase [Sphingosinicella humi]PWG02443.1 peptidase [Sphingosinicella humi]